MTTITWLTNRLRESDREALQTHFRSLGTEDRRLRFGLALGDESLAEYVARIDFEHDEVFAVRDDELALLGVVHVAFTDDAAELGLSVVSGARGQGVGNALFERAVVHLRNRGTKAVYVHCLSENQAMMHLASKHGMQSVQDQGESRARLELRRATPGSMFSEWFQDQSADSVQSLRETTLRARHYLQLLSPKG